MLKLLVLLAAILASAAAPAARQPVELHLLNWSDYIDPDLVKAFESSHHCHVKVDVYEETEAMLAKVQVGGGGYDLVIASDHTVPVLAKLGVIRKLDLTKVPNAANIDDRFVHPKYDPKGEWSLPYQWGTVGILYNRKKLGELKPSWGLLLDPAGRKGKYLFLDSPRDTLGASLIYTRASANSRDKSQLQSAGKLLVAAKSDPQCVGFDGSVANAKKVVTGQADLAMVYNGDAINAMKDSKSTDFDYILPPEGGIVAVDLMVVPAKAPNPDLAHAFANFILDPRNGAQLSNYVNFATPNKASLPLVDESNRANPRIYPTPDQLKSLEYLEDVGEATQLYDAIWTAVKAR